MRTEQPYEFREFLDRIHLSDRRNEEVKKVADDLFAEIFPPLDR